VSAVDVFPARNTTKARHLTKRTLVLELSSIVSKLGGDLKAFLENREVDGLLERGEIQIRTPPMVLE
jgi:hypothetical protein